ncbi:MAG: MoaD/ThiS family protein [Bacillota bacterium]|nr:MoaD/ThiS family protein [Bacillota bacterium]
MKVTVGYKGFLSSLAGCDGEQVELPDGATVGQLLEVLSVLHGDSFRQAVLPGGSRPLVALVSVDGRPAGLTDSLADGACVLIVRAVGGG